MKIYINDLLVTEKSISVSEGWNSIAISDNIKDITTTYDSVNREYDGIEFIYYFDFQYYDISTNQIGNHSALWIKVNSSINKLYLHTDK